MLCDIYGNVTRTEDGGRDRPLGRDPAQIPHFISLAGDSEDSECGAVGKVRVVASASENQIGDRDSHSTWLNSRTFRGTHWSEVGTRLVIQGGERDEAIGRSSGRVGAVVWKCVGRGRGVRRGT